MIAQKAVKGVAWAYGAFFTEKALTLLTTVVLARVLTPDDFGVVAASLLVVTFIDAFRDFGVRDALIYASDEVEITADTTFWLALGFGICQTLAVLALAPFAVNVIEDGRIVSVLQVLSAVFIINGLGLTHEALLQKRLQFRPRYVADLIATAFKTLTALGLVASGAGLWSIIAAHLVGAGVRTLARWLILDWRPRLRFSLARARMLVQFGSHIFLIGLMGALAERLDQFLIAAFLDQRQLAFFFIASRLPEMLLYQLNTVLTNVLFSLFASIKDQRELLMQSFFRTLKYSALATVPIGCGLIAVAPELVPVVFGNQWLPAVSLMQALAAAAIAMCLHWSSGDVLKALGRPDIVTKLTLIEIIYSAPTVAALLAYYRDPLAAAFGALGCSVLAGAVRLWIVARILDFSPKVYARCFGAALIGGGLILLTVECWRNLLEGLRPELILVTSVPLGIVAYAGSVWLMERRDLSAAAEVIRAAISRQAGGASAAASSSSSR